MTSHVTDGLDLVDAEYSDIPIDEFAWTLEVEVPTESMAYINLEVDQIFVGGLASFSVGQVDDHLLEAW